MEAHHDAQFVEDEDCAENHINHHCDDGEQHHQNSPVGAAPTVQHHQSSPIGAVPPKHPRRCITTSLAHPVPPRNEPPSRIQHDELVLVSSFMFLIMI